MNHFPIIFSSPMVRALLDGRKTMTRRLRWKTVKRGPHPDGALCYTNWNKVKAGDRLWVRENFMPAPDEAVPDKPRPTRWNIAYAAGGQDFAMAPAGYNPMLYNYERWTPCIHLPRWASRLTLTVTAVKTERIQDISEKDARAEGVLYVPGHGDITLADLQCDPGYSNFLDCRMGFEMLWKDLHGPESWDVNPEVVALSFTVARCNIDEMKAAA